MSTPIPTVPGPEDIKAQATNLPTVVTDTNTQIAGSHATASKDPKLTTIKNMDDLKNKAPDVYKLMMEGIAMNICNDLKGHQERLTEIMRDERRKAAGG